MKKTYFKPQFRVVKLHGRMPLMTGSDTKLKVNRVSSGGLEDGDDFIYGGGSDGDSDAFVAR